MVWCRGGAASAASEAASAAAGEEEEETCLWEFLANHVLLLAYTPQLTLPYGDRDGRMDGRMEREGIVWTSV